jgi:hypothetical protein
MTADEMDLIVGAPHAAQPWVRPVSSYTRVETTLGDAQRFG